MQLTEGKQTYQKVSLHTVTPEGVGGQIRRSIIMSRKKLSKKEIGRKRDNTVWYHDYVDRKIEG